MRNPLIINPQKEKNKIVSFLKKTFQEQKINKAVIGLSGGIDSAVAFYLLKKVLPLKNIFAYHLPYTETSNDIKFPSENFQIIPIKKIVDKLIDGWHEFKGSRQRGVEGNLSRANPGGKKTRDRTHQIRIGNIMARTRMIILFDQAKRHKALVCGTENKSEHLLGYFTRFGDSASDIEPITHLYKTQVYQLAKYLKIPEEIIQAKPTAGLWENQTDEGEFGFTYEEADQVLYLFHDRNKSLNEIINLGFKNAEKIIQRVKQNEFKRKTPYTI